MRRGTSGCWSGRCLGCSSRTGDSVAEAERAKPARKHVLTQSNCTRVLSTLARRVSTADGKEGAARGPVIKSVVRALRVLRAVHRSPQAKGLAEICREQGLHKTTALRLLRTLVALGMVSRKEGSGVYVADLAFWFRVSPFFRPALAFISDIQGLLDQTARSENATTVIIMPDENRRRTEVPAYGLPSVPVHIDPRHGGAVPLHATAGGKCYLADVSEEELEEYIAAGLERVTPDTEVSAKRLRAELAAVRRQSYALNRREAIVVSTGVSVPLRIQDEGAIGGLSLVCVGAELDEGYLRTRVPPLREAAERISSLLSYESFRGYMEEAEPEAPVPPAENAGELATSASTSRELVRSVGRAFRLMATLWDLREGESVAELARRRGLSRVTTYRLLQSLAAEQMVRKDRVTGNYHIDPILWLRLAPILQRAASADKLLALLLEQIAHSAGASIFLVYSDSSRRKAVLSACALPRVPLAVHPKPAIFPMLHTVAAGKCLLAAQSESDFAAYVRGGLAGATEQTITSPEQLAEELRRVRQSGYAVSRGEALPDVGGVAVPVQDRNGEVMATLAVVPLVSELSEQRIEMWVNQLRVGARAVAHVLGVGRTVREHDGRGRRD